jgi:hypothetical protein
METKICVFEENNITFLLSKDNGMMINATEMAKIFGKDVADFMANDGVKKFIISCLNNRNSGYINVKSESDLYHSVQKSGTLMHRILALKFAAWLSPDFEVWVYSTIEKLLFGKHVDREKSFEKTVSLQKEMNVLLVKPEKTGDDFNRYIEIRRLLSIEKAIRTNLTKETVSEMQDLFQESEED